MKAYDKTEFEHSDVFAKPFMKWAGGKTQLLQELEIRLPEHILLSKTIPKYVEAFVGGGAFFFYLKGNYDVKESYIIDINRELIVGYVAIKNNPGDLIDALKKIRKKYFSMKTYSARKKYFYELRDRYNDDMETFNYKRYSRKWIKRSSMLIFLNKTCFNGLFRQNSKGRFNVPFGNYKNPKICDEINIMAVHKCLKDTNIIWGDFYQSEKYIDSNTFVYFDPPYRPIKPTSNFTSYAKENFNEEDQKRLAGFYRKMSDTGAYLMLSNSDPKNERQNDDFFEELYRGFYIDRVLANRMINSKADKRGKIHELIITNYESNVNGDICQT